MANGTFKVKQDLHSLLLTRDTFKFDIISDISIV